MIIIKESIKDHDEIFDALCKELDDVNYVVGLGARTFSFIATDDDPEFTLTNLQEIFQDRTTSIVGDLHKVDPQECASFINYQCVGWSEVWDPRPEEEIKHIATTFWQEVGKLIDLHMTRAYYHEPAVGSFFHDGVMWRFCCIFINDAETRGVVLHGGGLD